MDIANQMRGMGHQEAWRGGEMGQQIWQNIQNLVAQRKARHDAQKQAKMAQTMQWAKMGTQALLGAISAGFVPTAGTPTAGMASYTPSAGSVSSPVDIWSQYSGWTP